MSAHAKRQHLSSDDSGSEATTASAKRARKSGQDDDVPLSRDEEFWYEDGTIALRARGVEFRVYKGVLADHSTVFSDMFSLPQPTPKPPYSSIDCITVTLDDSPEDLRRVFRALLPKKQATFVALELSNPSYHMISAYARLGHKYQIDTLLDQSLSWLKKHYTTDFDAWCAQKEFPFRKDSTYAIGVINLARLTQCDTILPTAMAVCCMLDGDDLLRGLQREDGTWEKLSDEDLETCITGICTLTQKSAAIVMSAMRSLKGVHGCVSPRQCSRGLQELMLALSWEPSVLANSHPFGTWEYYVGSRLDEDAICEPCTEEIQGRLRAQQLAGCLEVFKS